MGVFVVVFFPSAERVKARGPERGYRYKCVLIDTFISFVNKKKPTNFWLCEAALPVVHVAVGPSVGAGTRVCVFYLLCK